MPTVYGYCRVSSLDQADNGQSLDAQRRLLEEEYRREWGPKGFDWGEVYEDRAESGGKRFDSRPVGSVLNKVLARGDVVLFPKLDRGFRSTRDALRVLDNWQDRGVRAVFLDIRLDYGTAAGKLMLTIFAAGATFERERGMERTREVLAHKKRQGQLMGRPPWGLRYTGRGEKRKAVVVPEQLHVGKWVVKQHLDGFSFSDLAGHLNRSGTRKPDWTRAGLVMRNARWTVSSVFRIYRSTLRVLRLLEAKKVGS